MLSRTYAQTVMQLENDGLKEDLTRLKSQAGAFCGGAEYDREALEKLFRRLYQLRCKCCLRRLEVYFLPEIQNRVPESRELIADHRKLHQSSAGLHDLIGRSLYQALKARTDVNAALDTLIEQYCRIMHHMLEIEEGAIFPLAREKMSREGWFSMARIFIREEEESHNRHVMTNPDDDPEKYCPLSINRYDEKTDSALKYNVSDNSGLQGPELSSLHFGNGQLPFSNLTQKHGRQAVQQVSFQNS